MPEKHEIYKEKVPCRICGKKDWCFWEDHGENGILHHCHRVHDTAGVRSPVDGRIYLYKDFKTGCSIYEEEEQQKYLRAKWLESKNIKIKGKKKDLYKPLFLEGNGYEKKEKKYEKYPVASPEMLDKVYRYFLSLLVLERWHETLLREEWNSPVFPNLYEFLMSSWIIRSLPPNDFIRFSNKMPYKNLTRKAIMEKMIKKFGSLEGVPGFYQKEDGSWTIYYLSGMVFPTYNSKGQIVRLRIRDDYPYIDGNYDGKEGVYNYECTDERVGWFFEDEETKDKVFVHGINKKTGQVVKKILLNRKGQPDGKPLGKYKNLTSYKEHEVEEENCIRVFNKYLKGTKAGSSVSFYMKKGDDIRTVYITEGEKKSMVINAFTGCPVISLPGVSNYIMPFNLEEGNTASLMDVLRSAGVINVVLMYDADKTTKQDVAFHEKNAMRTILNHGFTLWVGDWLQYFGKGSDDCYIAGVQPILHRVTEK